MLKIKGKNNKKGHKKSSSSNTNILQNKLGGKKYY